MAGHGSLVNLSGEILFFTVVDLHMVSLRFRVMLRMLLVFTAATATPEQSTYSQSFHDYCQENQSEEGTNVLKQYVLA